MYASRSKGPYDTSTQHVNRTRLSYVICPTQKQSGVRGILDTITPGQPDIPRGLVVYVPIAKFLVRH
jgi:hypothetical protein